MEIVLHHLTLPLADPFGIARGTITHQDSLVVELRDGHLRGFGEVTVNDYYGHTYESMASSLTATKPLLDRYRSEPPEQLWPQTLAAVDHDTFALSALDMAAHDLWGRRHGQPCWQLWGLNWQQVPASSYTIGIDSLPRMVEKLQHQPGWPVYKVKLGTGDGAQDLQIVQRLRQHSEAPFRVDANCGWTAAQAIELSTELKRLGVEFIEQPLPAEASPEEQRAVFEQSALEVLADESCRTEADVQRCRGRFHGINVKLCKCGGLSPALRMLRHARSVGMRTMVGCMVETSIGISAAAQLLPLLDYADLDGAALLARDPANGVQLCQGRVSMPQLPGLGVELCG